MICAFVKRELRFLFRFLLRFFLLSFHRAMGCFLSCLRADDDDDDHILPTSQHKSRGVVASRNSLSLFLSRAFKRKEETLRLDRDNLGLGSQRDGRGLKEELTFLKASDSSSGNPVKDSESSRFHSCLPNTYFEKLQPEIQSSIPATPIKFCEEWENGKDSLERAPCSSAYFADDTQFGSRCSKDERAKQSLHTVQGTCEKETETNAPSASPSPPATDIQRKSKSLRFESKTDWSSRGYKHSPFPTPLKISDEMLTPGTVYPVTFINQPNDNKPRVRSQILYSDNHLSKNISHCEILEEEEEGFHLEQDSGFQNATPIPKKELKEVSNESECDLEASLSWLKDAAVINEERNSGREASHNHIPNLCESPADRLVLGMVDAHQWNEEENPQILSLESWCGNGIPNTTNKYKEDQKVNWHATPFEVRLEKALSDNSFISQRNQVCGKPNTFENDDTDTALSQLQPSTHPNL